MRIVCWNMRCATRTSEAWQYLQELAPDIALLQEVVSVPDAMNVYRTQILEPARKRSGAPQHFNTAVLAKAPSEARFRLRSRRSWINDEIERLAGNFVGCALTSDQIPLQLLSVHSPAWPIERERLAGIDVSEVKLENNPDIWGTELLWAGLVDQELVGSRVIGGDLNASETFDHLWPGGPRGNREVLDRMADLGFTEALRTMQGQLTPTFRNPKGGKVIHQIDHLFVTRDLADRLVSCETGNPDRVFGNSLSDHLPIIADFDSKSMPQDK